MKNQTRFFPRLRGAIAAGIQAYRGWSLASGDPALLGLFGGMETGSGVYVSEESAMRLAAVFACIQKISRTVAQIPLHVLKKDGRGGRAHATEHPLFYLLHRQPNRFMTSYQFRQMMQAGVTARGNAVAKVVRDNAGRVAEIIPIPADRVRFEVAGNSLRYHFLEGSKEIPWPTENVLHLRGLVTDGLIGLSPIRAARETIGEGIAAQNFGAGFYKRGMTLSYALVHPGKLGQEVVKNIKESLVEAYAGHKKAHQVIVLEEGMELKPVGISPEDAQWIETRRFNREEIAAIFDLPPHMIGSLERATFNNIEMMSLEFVLYSLTPWLVNWEQQLLISLFTEEEREVYEVKFNVDGLLRGDAKSRWESHAKAFMCGAKSPNEIRELENMNPREGGDFYYVPQNMTSGGETPSGEEVQENVDGGAVDSTK